MLICISDGRNLLKRQWPRTWASFLDPLYIVIWVLSLNRPVMSMEYIGVSFWGLVEISMLMRQGPIRVKMSSLGVLFSFGAVDEEGLLFGGAFVVSVSGRISWLSCSVCIVSRSEISKILNKV